MSFLPFCPQRERWTLTGASIPPTSWLPSRKIRRVAGKRTNTPLSPTLVSCTQPNQVKWAALENHATLVTSKILLAPETFAFHFLLAVIYKILPFSVGEVPRRSFMLPVIDNPVVCGSIPDMPPVLGLRYCRIATPPLSSCSLQSPGVRRYLCGRGIWWGSWESCCRCWVRGRYRGHRRGGWHPYRGRSGRWSVWAIDRSPWPSVRDA